MKKIVQYKQQTGMLLIEAYDGTLLKYQHVPTNVYNALMAAPLRDNFFQLNIVGVFDYQEAHRLN